MEKLAVDFPHDFTELGPTGDRRPRWLAVTTWWDVGYISYLDHGIYTRYVYMYIYMYMYISYNHILK